MTAPKRSATEGAALTQESTEALRVFAEAPTARERLGALRRLFTAKQMAAVRRQPEYGAALDWCAGVARGDAEATDVERVHAIAVLVVVQSGRAALDEAALGRALGAAMATRIPPIELLADTEDQARVLAAAREFETSWLREYALPRALNEAPKSNIRREAVAAVFARSETVVAALTSLAEAIEAHGAKLPSAAVLRLTLLVLGDVLDVVRGAPAAAESSPALGLVRFAEILRAKGVVELGTPEAAGAFDALARLTHALCAGRLRWVLDPSTYEAVLILRGALGRKWAAVITRSAAVGTLLEQVNEALYVQVRAGVPDAALRRVLEGLCASEADFEAKQRLLAREPGVSEAMARWLGGESAAPAAVSGAAEVNAESERDLIASLAVAAATLDDHRFDHPDDTTLPWALAEGWVQSAMALLARRRVRVAARRGDVMPFDPLRHEIVRLPPQGVTLVRVMTPLVVEDRDDRTIVIRKAMVEAFQPKEAP